MGKTVTIRIEDDLREEFTKALELTGMGETQFIKAAIKAFVDHVKEHGEVTLPLTVVPKSFLKKKGSSLGIGTATDAAEPSFPSTVLPQRLPSAVAPEGEPHARAVKPGAAKPRA